ncbi:MAG: M14 family zinc carboxypeptidase [Ignavibacteria bacterium]|nr:M14 family zinc carboxypeptidase [Ignavibacteria bacterium]
MKNFFLLTLFLFSSQFTLAQKLDEAYFAKNGEVYFRMYKSPKIVINNLSKIISIDNVTKDSIYAYANEKEFYLFQQFDIPIQVLKHPGDVENVKMSSSIEGIMEWDSYPTYDAYVAMMYQFQTNYPALCRIVDAGTTVQGRKILFAVISDNINQREEEPRAQYSSTMHGDETTGYVLMLRLIDYLLSNYGTDTKVTNLVNNLEIWINPNANPDGTYRSGNSTVTGARRGNANNIDINRNFPDPKAGLHPDGYAWQPETIAMMNLAQTYNFVISANFHGGTEVVNYPWDTWYARHPDDNWFQFISHLYADTAQGNSPSTSYMRSYNDGITNGYDWYMVEGGRQDYMNYFANCKEVCIEISNTKLVAGSSLPTYWNYNKQSLLNYLENTLHGFRGVVTDVNGNPIKAKVTVSNHDAQNSHVYSDSVTGNYHRMIYAGNYSASFSADSFITQTFTNVSVSNFSTTELNVQLQPTNPIPVELISFKGINVDNSVELSWTTATETNNKGFEIERAFADSESNWENIGFVNGVGTSTSNKEYRFIDDTPLLLTSKYRLKQIDFDGTFSYSKEIQINTGQELDFHLSQNYPNPFNMETVIVLYVPKERNVQIKVYNSLGAEVAEILNEVKRAGIYELKFDGSELSSGIYFYKINAGNFSSIKKMILMK